MYSFPVFYIPFGEDRIIDDNFTELKKDTRFVNGAAQGKQDLTKQREYMRILDSYPILAEKILDKFSNYKHDIGLTAKFTITTSWLTKLEKGDHISPHNHKNCEFSGVLYYDDYYTHPIPLQFDNPLIQISQFHDIGHKPTGYLSDWTLEPSRGLLIFFPSYIIHSTEKSTVDKARRSLAFNFAPIGVFGSGDSTMDTKWLSS